MSLHFFVSQVKKKGVPVIKAAKGKITIFFKSRQTKKRKKERKTKKSSVGRCGRQKKKVFFFSFTIVDDGEEKKLDGDGRKVEKLTVTRGEVKTAISKRKINQ